MVIFPRKQCKETHLNIPLFRSILKLWKEGIKRFFFVVPIRRWNEEAKSLQGLIVYYHKKILYTQTQLIKQIGKS